MKARPLLVALVVALCWSSAAVAATPPNLAIHYFWRPTGDNCATTTLKGTSPYSQTGLGSDDAGHLLVSCQNNNLLEAIDPTTYKVIATYAITNANTGLPLAGIGALADGDGTLWACDLSAYPLAKRRNGASVGTVDLTTGLFTPVWMAQDGCVNGLAVDPLSGYVWADGGRYKGSSQFIDEWNPNTSQTVRVGDLPTAQGFVSGIVPTSDRLFLADNYSTYRSIYELTPGLGGTEQTLIAPGTTTLRFEDMECMGSTLYVKWFNKNAIGTISVDTC